MITTRMQLTEEKKKKGRKKRKVIAFLHTLTWCHPTVGHSRSRLPRQTTLQKRRRRRRRRRRHEMGPPKKKEVQKSPSVFKNHIAAEHAARRPASLSPVSVALLYLILFNGI